MAKKKFLKTVTGKKIKLPIFFPDATRAVVRTLDSKDIQNTKTPGILVNTYHLYNDLGKKVLKNHQGIRGFMNWHGGVISDSGGFQVMSLVKASSKQGKVTDEGVIFKPKSSKKIKFTPEESIRFQMLLNPDMLVVLDDFTKPGSTRKEAKLTVKRTVDWAKRSKQEFEKICKQNALTGPKKPYLLAVVQGGNYMNLRKECAQRLLEIGFDGYGYGGWPLTEDGKFNWKIAKFLSDYIPSEFFLYGLGIGKPDEITGCVKLGFSIFDCVLPTRDARHRRLYVFEADSIDKIKIKGVNFYSYYTPDKEKHCADNQPVSQACDCLLCKNYSRAYLAHLFRIGELSAKRLATIHNLRFYSLLMEKLKKTCN